jgi:hypothetical protein
MAAFNINLQMISKLISEMSFIAFRLLDDDEVFFLPPDEVVPQLAYEEHPTQSFILLEQLLTLQCPAIKDQLVLCAVAASKG